MIIATFIFTIVWLADSCNVSSTSTASTFAVQNHLIILSTKRYNPSLRAARKGVQNSRLKKKQYTLEELISVETDLRTRGYEYIIGSDDTGGANCIAGPVVCASCCILQPLSSFLPISEEKIPLLPAEVVDILSIVNDSKILSREQRQQIYKTVMSLPDLFGVFVAHRSPEEIDEENLIKATQLAFAESIESLVSKYDLPQDKTYAIVDGKISPKLYASDRIQSNEFEQTKSQQELEQKIFPVRPKVNADAEVYTCALASIVAGVSRERMMMELHEQHSTYGFDRNMGRGTKDHIEAIHKHGAVEGVHRFSFKQVKGR